jgi:glycosyltransferase involved in cell wall biosynthesis
MMTSRSGSTPSTAFVGTYPPTACGLATFTASLAGAMFPPGTEQRFGIVRVVDEPVDDRRPEIVGTLVRGDRRSMQQAIELLADFDAVVLQHEYGIYGGSDGEDVVDLIRLSPVPVIVVLHTVLTAPSPHQRQVLEEVVDAADRVVVQTEAARARLTSLYRIDADRVAVIPHGARNNLGSRAGRTTSPTILTWGLIGPGKGLEHAITAIAELVDLDPQPTYVIAGATHPKVLESHGESYRNALMDLAAELGVGHLVLFDNEYRETDAILRIAREVDVVLLPYDSRDQVTSGVLVEAITSSRPVVATRFPHAVELLSGGAGLLVDHGDASEMSRALRAVLTSPAAAGRMSDEAARLAPAMFWETVGGRYLDLASSLAAELTAA